MSYIGTRVSNFVTLNNVRKNEQFRIRFSLEKSYLALQKESYVVLVIKCIFLECNAVYVKHEYVYQN
jgi:hypothetical protein